MGRDDVLLANVPIGEISNIWECNQIPPNGQNVTRFCDKQLDDALRTVQTHVRSAMRMKLLAQEMRMIVAANVPTIVLYVWKRETRIIKNLKG